MKITPEGREHQAGDLNCPACGAAIDGQWPRRHRDGAVKDCSGFVHSEVFLRMVRTVRRRLYTFAMYAATQSEQNSRPVAGATP